MPNFRNSNISSSDSSPKITTIIPTFQRPEKLRMAIQSVLSQEYIHFEILVLDNHSDHPTQDIVNEFRAQDSRIKYLRHEKNIGAHANFRFGIEQVITPFFNVLPDDDIVLPGFYQTAIDNLLKYPAASCYIGTTIFKNERGVCLGTSSSALKREGFYTQEQIWTEFMRRKFPQWISIIFRKEYTDKIGTFDTTIFPADTDYLVRLISRFPIVATKTPCALFSVHPDSMSFERNLKLVWPATKEILEKIKSLNLDSKLAKKIQNCMFHFLAKNLLEIGIKAFLAKNQSLGNECLRILRNETNRRSEWTTLKIFSTILSIHPMMLKPLKFLFFFRQMIARKMRAKGIYEQFSK